ncbi:MULTISPECIES: CDP-glycerol glycerophosphotransferase family protein [Terrisporobacter]
MLDYYLVKSKFWVVNCKLLSYCIKRNNQVYIQTWVYLSLTQAFHYFYIL